MSAESLFRRIFEPKAVREQRKLDLQEAAFAEERQATADYLTGKIGLNQYRNINEKLYPLTKIDLRELAQAVRR